MVHLPPSQASPAPTSSEQMEVQEVQQDGSPQTLTALQLALNPSAAVYHGYETYIENGLICLKHKIRNIEKKKLKLESYKVRLKNEDTLNQDQMEAVARYDEVVHNLKFAKELQKTLGALTQDLLRAQKKASRQEELLRAEAEQSRLSVMLQVQYVLRSLQRDSIRMIFCSTREHGRFVSAPELDSLLDLASVLGCKRDESMSLEDQMEQASLAYLDLLEGKDTPVAGSTYKRLKEKLLRLVDCGFFDHLPAPQKTTQDEAGGHKPDASGRPCSLPALITLNSKEVPSRKFLNRHYLPENNLTGHDEEEDVQQPNWKAEFLALKEREPPDSWETEFSDAQVPSQPVLQKPWKGAAGFIPKNTVNVRRPLADPKQKQQRKTKGGHSSKSDAEMLVPVEAFSSPLSLAKDPVLRRQQLDHLMDQITGSFSFIQDSLLDGEASPTNGRTRRLGLSPISTPLVQRELKKNTSDILPQTQHSTPLHVCLLSAEGKSGLANGDQTLDNSDLELHTDTPQTKHDDYTSPPPLYRRESCMSLSLEDKSSMQSQNQALCKGEAQTHTSPPTFSVPSSRRSLNMASAAALSSVHSVFSAEPPLSTSSQLKLDENGLAGSVGLSYSTASSLRYSTASTQTPPELNVSQDDLQMESAYISESEVSGTSHVYSSPGASQSGLGQQYYPRSALRGMARGGRGLSHSYRTPGGARGGYDAHRVSVRSPAGGFSHRESGPLHYSSRENGYQLCHKRVGGTSITQRNSSVAAWSDSSQVSSPDRDVNTANATTSYLVDSGQGDSLSASPSELPAVSSQPPHALLPLQVYPLSQPLRVAFSAARTANLAPGTLDQPVAFDLLHSNLGESFDVASGRFFCPAAGTYVFFFHMLKLAVNVPLYINLMRNEEVMVSAYANDGAPDHETASNHAVLQLYQGDQVWLRLHRGAIYGSSWKYSTFSGFLLYQD